MNASEADAIACRLESEMPLDKAVPPAAIGLCFKCGSAVVFHNIEGRAAMKKICLPCVAKEFQRGLD